MKRVTRNGVIAVAAASGAMAVAVPAWADAGADATAAGSPGVISGNGIQLPVDLPVNVCGNTVNVVGLLNPAAGNTCANEGGAAATGGASGSSATSGGATAQGAEEGSPGVISGNGIQLPVDLPVNISGNSVNVVGALNPATGNTSVNTSGDHPSPPKTATPKPPTVKPPAPPKTPTEPKAPAAPPAPAALAHTGTDLTGAAAAGSAALLLAGTALHRRFRPGRTR
ncbi:chaplin [Streptomyces sp. NPDC086777]|uniref:chaplin n=1 Tax=Streptomyces sp. NPDC086777 TaxID=3154866 RepID=UPI00344D13C1